MCFGGDVGQEMGDIGEPWVLWTENALQLHVGFLLSFRHLGGAAEDHRLAIELRRWQTGSRSVIELVEAPNRVQKACFEVKDARLHDRERVLFNQWCTDLTCKYRACGVTQLAFAAR